MTTKASTEPKHLVTCYEQNEGGRMGNNFWVCTPRCPVARAIEKAKNLCSHCGRKIGTGGADGLDARCYQYRKRNGKLPPKDVREPMGEVEQLGVTVPKALGKQVRAAAKKAGHDGYSPWIRSLIEKELSA